MSGLIGVGQMTDQVALSMAASAFSRYLERNGVASAATGFTLAAFDMDEVVALHAAIAESTDPAVVAIRKQIDPLLEQWREIEPAAKAAREAIEGLERAQQATNRRDADPPAGEVLH